MNIPLSEAQRLHEAYVLIPTASTSAQGRQTAAYQAEQLVESAQQQALLNLAQFYHATAA
jgi:hypothetical protein